MLLWIVVIIVVGFAAYVRLAPADVDVWHQRAEGAEMGETVLSNRYIWREAVADEGGGKLSRLDGVIMATPRTTRLAGSLEAGQITYVTRSAVMGFPDYTTVGIYDDQGVPYIEINARSRFGSSDLGVNASRVKRWLAAL